MTDQEYKEKQLEQARKIVARQAIALAGCWKTCADLKGKAIAGEKFNPAGNENRYHRTVQAAKKYAEI